jgi:hypothetical protein
MGGQSSSLSVILLMSGDGGVRAVSNSLGVGGLGRFQATQYSSSELSVVAVARVCGRKLQSLESMRF